MSWRRYRSDERFLRPMLEDATSVAPIPISDGLGFGYRLHTHYWTERFLYTRHNPARLIRYST